MKEFAGATLILEEDVKKGDKKSLLGLFSAAERFKPMEVLCDAEEGSTLRVSLGELGEIDLKLGADVKKGEKKTIMTLFWFSERSRLIEMKKDAKAKESVPVTLWLL